MAPSVRSVAIELAENAKAIIAWRDSLPERQRKRLVHPLSVTRRWRHRERASADIARYLHTFVSASRKIAPDQANIPIEDLDAALTWLTACRAKTMAVANAA